MLNVENKESKTYSYSSLGAGLLGYTLGLSQKTNFPELLQKKIFDQYKMTDSYTSPKKSGNKLVKVLDSNGEMVSNWDSDVLFGAGGIVVTSQDLTKFAKAQFGAKNKALTLTRKPTFTVSENMIIGLGRHILKSHKGKKLMWHNGGIDGYSSSMTVNVDDETAVVILSNVSTYNPKMKNIDKLCFELSKTLTE
jgi:CubicO group peptidase (beta-lactamase class C family)